jgi:hypothetical protein
MPLNGDAISLPTVRLHTVIEYSTRLSWLDRTGHGTVVRGKHG